jgi:hypothetical protein
MRYRKIILLTLAIAITGAIAGTYRILPFAAQAQLPGGPGPNGECVSYGPNNALSMCLHTFTGGTRCVATGGQDGDAAALQCDFK